jgi:hypothetical protein
MSIPPLSPQPLSSLEPQGFSCFEEPFGTKNQENKKCPSNWKKLVERQQGARKWNVGKCPGKSFGKTNGEAQSDHSGRGYIGILFDISMFFPAPFPLYLFKQKKKPSMDQGKPLTTLGFLDIIYCPWTVFIFSGRDLFAVYNLCQETIIHVHPTPPPSTPLFPRATRGFGI